MFLILKIIFIVIIKVFKLIILYVLNVDFMFLIFKYTFDIRSSEKSSLSSLYNNKFN